MQGQSSLDFEKTLKKWSGTKQKEFDSSLSLVDLHYDCFGRYNLTTKQIVQCFDNVFKHFSSDCWNRGNERFRLFLLLSHLMRDPREILASLKKSRNSHVAYKHPVYIAKIIQDWKIHENKTKIERVLDEFNLKCIQLCQTIVLSKKLSYYIKNYVFDNNSGISSHIDIFLTKTISLLKRNENLTKQDKENGTNEINEMTKYVENCSKKDRKEREREKGKDKEKEKEKENKEMEYVYQREMDDPLSCVGSSILGNWPIEYKNKNGVILEKMALKMEDVRKQQRRSRNEDQLKKDNETLDDEFEKFWNENFPRWDMIDNHCCLDRRIWDWKVKIKYHDQQIDNHKRKLNQEKQDT